MTEPTEGLSPSLKDIGSKELITQGVVDLFSDISRRPSYMEMVSIPSVEVMVNHRKRNEKAFAAACERINGLVASEEDKTHALRFFQNGTFGASEGSELRLMLNGLKPAFLTNCGEGWEKKWTQRFPDIPPKLVYPPAIARIEDVYPEVEFTQITGNGLKYDVAYVPENIGKMVREYDDVFRKLGYDTSESPSNIAQEVFTKEDPIAQSLLLGYPLDSAIFVNLNDITHYTREDPDEAATVVEVYWNGARSILSEEQFETLQALAKDPGNVKVVAHLLNRDVDAKLTYRNDRFRQIWQESGFTEGLIEARKTFYGENVDEDILDRL